MNAPTKDPGEFYRRIRKRMKDAGFIVGVKNAIYAVQVCPPDGPIKIGRSTDPCNRWVQIMYSWPFEYEIKVLALVPNMQHREDEVLEALREWRIRGEWFKSSQEMFVALRAACDRLYE